MTTGLYLVARVFVGGFGSPTIIEAESPAVAARIYGAESGDHLAVWMLGRHPMTYVVGAEPGTVYASERL